MDENKDLMELYQKTIVQHAKHPKNSGLVCGHHCERDGSNPLCGDKLKLGVSFDQVGLVSDIIFDAKGCAISIASASMMTSVVTGLSAFEVGISCSLVRNFCDKNHNIDKNSHDYHVNNKELFTELECFWGVRSFPARVKCVMLPWETLSLCASEYL
jgi:nitrogen fixation NifU-like protein